MKNADTAGTNQQTKNEESKVAMGNADTNSTNQQTIIKPSRWATQKVAAGLYRLQEEKQNPGSTHRYLSGKASSSRNSIVPIDASRFYRHSFQPTKERSIAKNPRAVERLAIAARLLSEEEFAKLLRKEPIARANEINELSKGRTLLNTPIKVQSSPVPANHVRGDNPSSPTGTKDYQLVELDEKSTILRAKLGSKEDAIYIQNKYAREYVGYDLSTAIGSELAMTSADKLLTHSKSENNLKNRRYNVGTLFKYIKKFNSINAYERAIGYRKAKIVDGKLKKAAFIYKEDEYIAEAKYANPERLDELTAILERQLEQYDRNQKSVSTLGHEINHGLNPTPNDTSSADSDKVPGIPSFAHFSKADEMTNALSLLKQYRAEVHHKPLRNFNDLEEFYFSCWNPINNSAEMNAKRKSLPSDIQRLFITIEMVHVKQQSQKSHMIEDLRLMIKDDKNKLSAYRAEDAFNLYLYTYQPGSQDESIKGKRESSIDAHLLDEFEDMEKEGYHFDEMRKFENWIHSNDILNQL